LNDELLQLADYMKETTFAFKITCLQTMLPALLKASYDKQFRLLNPKAKVASYFQENAVLSFAEAEEKQLLAELKKAVQAEEVRLEYLVKNKNQVKTIRYVRPLLSQEDYEQLQLQQSKTAVRKQELLQQLATLAYLPVKYYTERKISTSVLNQAQEQGWLAFEEVEAYRDPFANQTFEKTAHLALNESQQYACDTILQANQEKDAKTFLLEWITGSGKTE